MFRKNDNVKVEDIVENIRNGVVDECQREEKGQMPKVIEKIPYIKDYLRENMTEAACC